MWSPRTLLELCDRLREQVGPPPLVEGTRLGRKFADLGFEEFVVLPNRKLLSIFTGSTVELSDDLVQHLFWVPCLSDSVAMLRERGFDVHDVQYVDQREWSVVVSCAETEQKRRSVKPDLAEAFLDLLGD